MNEGAVQIIRLWPVAVYAAAVFLLVSVMLGLSAVLGQRHRERSTGAPYESGMVPTSPARMPFEVKFYLVAVLFVVFDLEVIFLFAWAVVAREAGWRGYGEILVFIGVLAAALAYLWRQGALDGGMTAARKRKSGL